MLNLKTGDWFDCVYNGVVRKNCEVVEMGATFVRVRWDHSYRCFSYHKIRDLRVTQEV